jgi:hypothetical protein
MTVYALLDITEQIVKLKSDRAAMPVQCHVTGVE